jgi:hypothetical protein
MNGNSRLAALRSMLHDMEREVGLQQLSSTQRDVYYAACLMRDDDSLVRSEEMRTHPILSELPRSSFFRILRELSEAGYLRQAGSPRSGLYQILR